ncbi:RsmD family RNA methyltransferase [Deinococcus maricopensis]|uniref:Methyltransferase n=1 Tax=Deinococcus maricopensis (strain DSM 21211 / LMG 22137 / NRRL B-23946 / LB-34) TaxID=709986 RepID=E8U6H4_DEIML|nr:RsmD family RNA methyltransferase [Deinococcus maricopensis]ADV66663.1 Conserved hypothetical protein CHP00095 [Deinococcus maricopensis DSM 21211]
MSIRILGGTAKGRAITVPDSARPTGARLRKSLFDLLATRAPTGTFLDLYAGSGAVGLEAASRGYTVTLTELDLRAVKALEANATHLQLPTRPRIRRGDGLALLPELGAFDVVFVDPPYTQDIPTITAGLLKRRPLTEDGLLIIQHPTQLTLADRDGYTRDERRYGSNVLTLYTHA